MIITVTLLTVVVCIQSYFIFELWKKFTNHQKNNKNTLNHIATVLESIADSMDKRGRDQLEYCKAQRSIVNFTFNEKIEKLYEDIAVMMYERGDTLGVSTGIDESTTMGYGHLDNNGYWKFSLPPEIVEKILKENKLDKAINGDSE